MTWWNWLQICVGLLLTFGLGFASGLVAGRSDQQDDPPLRPPASSPRINFKVKLVRGRRFLPPL